MKVAIITSAHHPLDGRIYFKQALSLSNSRHTVTLFARSPSGSFHPPVSPVQFDLIKASPSRAVRFLFTASKLTWRALRTGHSVLHFHDPEFILFGWFLRLFTSRTLIIDLHEDYKASILKKLWIPKPFRFLLAQCYGLLEWGLLWSFHKIILAEDSYVTRFRKRKNVVVVRNFAIIDLAQPKQDQLDRDIDLVYIGGIKYDRGVFEILQLLSDLKKYSPEPHLYLIGPVSENGLREKIEHYVKQKDLIDNVSLFGYVPLSKARQLLQRCRLGLALLHDTPNYRHSIPTKIFDYVAAGVIPITYDLPTWKNLVDTLKIGTAVPYKDQESLKQSAVSYLRNWPPKSSKMRIAQEKLIHNFSWQEEEKKLLALYESLTFFDGDQYSSALPLNSDSSRKTYQNAINSIRKN